MKTSKKQRNNYQPHRFPYLWKLADGYPAKGIEAHGCKVFGTFICGGGSSMGYKLAGYEHLGGVELDPTISAIYKENHHPKYLYTMDIRDFNKLESLPEELYNLDLLDGSPPCSTFSTAGSREKAWGKEKRFAEGQKLQRLDDLVFVYCDTIAKLKPKVCLLENVSGLVKGNGKIYTKAVVSRLNEIGYNVQVFLLNGTTMGVPQRRERCFFIGLRKDFKLPKLVLNFNEQPILFGEIADFKGKKISGEKCMLLWNNRKRGDGNQSLANLRLFGKPANFGQSYLYLDRVCPTITTHKDCVFHFEKPLLASEEEIMKVTTFPVDYNWGGEDLWFLAGMSVAPIMAAQISCQIYKQWLSKIK